MKIIVIIVLELTLFNICNIYIIKFFILNIIFLTILNNIKSMSNQMHEIFLKYYITISEFS